MTKIEKTPDSLINATFHEIATILLAARHKVYQFANSTMVQAYWNTGRVIVESEQKGKAKADYGQYLMRELSVKLTAKLGKGFDERNLRYMRQFFLGFPIRNAVRSELSWTHYRLLLKIEREVIRQFYVDECIAANWSTRQLERQINSFYYERLLSSKNKKPVRADAKKTEPTPQPEDLIKDPYVLEFFNLKANERHTESQLESAVLENLQEFILELGKGFSFVGRQKRLSTPEGSHFYMDLVFYNYILKCFLIIDLKTTKLTHQDIGQMDFYVRYFEDNIKQESDNPTIGLILCAEKDETIVKYSVLNDSSQLFASKYQLYLPSIEELTRELERERDQLLLEQKLAEDTEGQHECT